MAFTTAQLATFKAAILADANLAAARIAGNHGAIAAYYNGAGTGTIWRPSISATELNTAIVWSEFIALTAVTQNAYLALLQAGAIDATSANVRGGFVSIFPVGVSRTNLTALAQRVPSVFEALFITAQVCALFGQTVTVADVAAALGS